MERRPSIGTSMRNFREYDAPLRTRLRLLFRNNWLKLKRRDNCCGNGGEPGC